MVGINQHSYPSTSQGYLDLPLDLMPLLVALGFWVVGIAVWIGDQQPGIIQFFFIRAHQQLLDAREQERHQIACELHDNAVQQLLGISYQVVALQQKIRRLASSNSANSESINPGLDSLRQEILRVTAKLREMIGELRPAGLEEFGLGSALEGFVHKMRRQAGRACPQIEMEIASLSPEKQIERLVVLRLQHFEKDQATDCYGILDFGIESIDTSERWTELIDDPSYTAVGLVSFWVRPVQRNCAWPPAGGGKEAVRDGHYIALLSRLYGLRRENEGYRLVDLTQNMT